jgi:hypothetical protein
MHRLKASDNLQNQMPCYCRVQPDSSVPILAALTKTRSFKRRAQMEFYSYIISYKHLSTLHQDAANRTPYSTDLSTTHQHWPRHGSGRTWLPSTMRKNGFDTRSIYIYIYIYICIYIYNCIAQKVSNTHLVTTIAKLFP